MATRYNTIILSHARKKDHNKTYQEKCQSSFVISPARSSFCWVNFVIVDEWDRYSERRLRFFLYLSFFCNFYPGYRIGGWRFASIAVQNDGYVWSVRRSIRQMEPHRWLLNVDVKCAANRLSDATAQSGNSTVRQKFDRTPAKMLRSLTYSCFRLRPMKSTTCELNRQIKQIKPLSLSLSLYVCVCVCVCVCMCVCVCVCV